MQDNLKKRCVWNLDIGATVPPAGQTVVCRGIRDHGPVGGFSAWTWFHLTKMNDFYIFSFRILFERSVSPYIIVDVTSQAVTYSHLKHLSNCCGIMYAISVISKERLHEYLYFITQQDYLSKLQKNSEGC